MIAAKLLPRPWRRQLIDAVYGAEDRRGLHIYLASLWGGLLVLALLLTGTTPWSGPAEREGRVASLEPVTCEAILGDDDAAAARIDTAKSSSKAATKAGTSRNRSGCRQLLSDAERAQLGRTEATISYLQAGGPTPPALSMPEDSPLRSWVDANVCRMGGVDGADRGALAWHVQQGIGECGGWERAAARLPLTIWAGPIIGMLLTPLLLLWLLYLLIRHTLRLPATRRAYRRLYGSEHKAP